MSPSAAPSNPIDPWGRVILTADDVFELFYRDTDLAGTVVSPTDETRQFNDLCRRWDKPAEMLASPAPLDIDPEHERERRVSTWFIDDAVREIDLREMLLSRCTSDAARARVEMEMTMFEARGMEPILRAMLALVDHFRRNGILWGVGRGSSVSSYCLYLIGIHKCDSLAFNLDIGEFLKP